MSELGIYNVSFSPEMNAKIDNIRDYLGSLSPVVYTYAQYQKIDLDMSIKLNTEQIKQTSRIGNYLDLYQDNKHFYFFITKANWTAKNTVSLDISLDTVNTFADDFSFSEKTHIIREHRNRYTNNSKFIPGASQLIEIVDAVDEGVSGTVQYKQSDDAIYTENEYTSQPWYLLYRNLATGSAVEAILLPKTKIPFNAPASQMVKYDTTNMPTGIHYITLGDNSEETLITFKIGDNNKNISLGSFWNNNKIEVLTYTVISGTGGSRSISVRILINKDGKLVYRDLGNTGTITIFKGIKYRTGSSYLDKIADINNLPATSYGGSSTGTIQYSKELADIDRTDSKIIKLIELPYCPVRIYWDQDLTMHLPENWTITAENFLKPNSPEVELGQTILENYDLGLDHIVKTTPTVLNTIAKQNYKNTVLTLDVVDTPFRITDPKLKHSSLSTFKLSYDSYAIPVALERLDMTQPSGIFTNIPTLSVEFKPSNSITSNLAFRANFSTKYTMDSDYANILVATRNNEAPLYNSAYLDYLRTGYNYDRKAQTTQNITSWVGATASIIGSIASIAKAATGNVLGAIAAASLTASAISNLASTIGSTITGEQSLKAKLDSLQAQANTIRASDDLNLLNWYNENKLHIVRYQASPAVITLMEDLFHYCGYATERRGIPTMNNRIWFDYIQCEPVFKEELSTTYDRYLDDIKARYSAGITVYHRYNGEYDFEQQYQNWERSLF